MLGGPSPDKLAARFVALAQRYLTDGPAERLDRAQRRLLDAVARNEPATLGEVSQAVGRGAPAVSRSVDALVRAGLVDRIPDPDNRRRLALTITKAGSDLLQSAPKGTDFAKQLGRFAQSELRAIERAIEILERPH